MSSALETRNVDSKLAHNASSSQDTRSGQLFNYLLDTMFSILLIPVRMLFSIASRILALLRPISPQLIPLAVGFSLVPLLALLSLSAGFVVWKNVAVGWEYPMYLVYGDGVPPYAEVPLNLVPKQPYDYAVYLAVPATEANYALGNFMASLTLATMSNKTLTTMRRPAIATPPSRLSWLSPMSRPGVVNIHIPLLSSYASGVSNAIAKVELGRRDGWKSLGEGHGRELSVLSASLEGAIRHHGIRGVATRFPISVSLVASMLFFAVSSLFLAVVILPSIPWNLHYDTPGDAASTGVVPVSRPLSRGSFPPSDDSDDGGKPVTRRRASRGRSASRSRRRSSDVKAEPEGEVMPSADSTRSPLRRRRSSKLSDREAAT